MTKVACIQRRLLRPSIIMVAEKEDEQDVHFGRKVRVYRLGDRFSLTFRDAETGRAHAMMLDACVYMKGVQL